MWAGVVLAALAALVVPALRSPARPVQQAQPVADVAVRTDTHPPAYPAWVPPAPQPTLPQLMVLAAHDPRPLTDVVRRAGPAAAARRRNRTTSSPVRRAMHSVDASMPGFRLVDSSRLTDGFGELCLVQLRARNAFGTVIVVNVVPPQQWPGIHTEPLVTQQSAGERQLLRTHRLGDDADRLADRDRRRRCGTGHAKLPDPHRSQRRHRRPHADLVT